MIGVPLELRDRTRPRKSVYVDALCSTVVHSQVAVRSLGLGLSPATVFSRPLLFPSTSFRTLYSGWPLFGVLLRPLSSVAPLHAVRRRER